MKKRILCLILSAVLLLPLLTLGVRAEEHQFYRVRIDAGNGPVEEQAILSDGELYIPAESFGRYTNFEFDGDTNTFLMKGQEKRRAFKFAMINPNTKKIGVINRMFDLKDCFVVDGVVYLPFCQMMPILNGQIKAVEDGIIYVANPKVTLAGVLYDFYINDYYFDLYEEFYGDMEDGFEDGFFKKLWSKGGMLAGYMLPSYLFDSVVDFRLDRLDFVFDSGTFEDYRKIMSDYLRDENLFLRANEAHDDPRLILSLINWSSEKSEPLNDVLDWVKKLKKVNLKENSYLLRGLAKDLVERMQAVEDMPDYVYDADDFLETWHDDSRGISIADAFELFEYVYVYFTHVEDNRKMLDAVYNIEAGGNWKDVQYRAAMSVYDLYGQQVMPAMTDRVARELIKNGLEETAVGGKLKLYELTAKISGAAWELVIPGDTGDVSVLILHAGVADSARTSAMGCSLNSEAEVEDYRLSLLLMMLASRECYKIMADVAEGYGHNAGEYNAKIEKLEERIMGLYLAAENLKYEAYDNFTSIAEENRKLLKDAGFFEYTEPIAPGESITTEPPAQSSGEEVAAFMEFLNRNPVYRYYSLLDINRDGCVELIAKEAMNPGSHDADLYVYRNGQVSLGYEDIWGTDDNLYYNPNHRWLESVSMEGGEGGVWFYSLDKNGTVTEQSFTEYSYSGKWYNGSPARDAAALEAWQALKDQYDPSSSVVVEFLPTGAEEAPVEVPEETYDVPADDTDEMTAGPLHYYFLAEHPEYDYYALLDINQDGTDEILVSESNVTGEQKVDIWVNRGGLYYLAYEDIWAVIVPLSYNPGNRWVENMLFGAMGGGMEFFYLDDEMNVVRESFEDYVYDGEFYNGKPLEDSEDAQAYQRLKDAYDPETSEEIVFQPAP